MKSWAKSLLAVASLGAVGAVVIANHGAFAASAPPPASNLQTVYTSPVALSRAVANASDANLPAVVAWVNGEAIQNKAVAQAEVLIANRQGPNQTAMTQTQLEEAALQLVIKQVVLAQAASRQGLDPTSVQADAAYQADVASNPSEVEVVTSGSSNTAPSPSSAWVRAYESSVGTNRLLLKAVANIPKLQQLNTETSYISNLIGQSNVIVAPNVP